jgi:hypothetical protein
MNLGNRLGGILLVAMCLLAAPAVARADAGIPMMPLPYPTYLWFLPAVVVLESLYVLTAVRVPIPRAVLAISAVNAATTGLGFPLAWLIYHGARWYAGFPGGGQGAFISMQYVPMWLCMRLFPDWTGTSDGTLSVLAVYLTLLVPAYLISRYLKTWVIGWYDLLALEGDTKGVVLGANRASFALLALVGCALLAKSLHGM